MAVRTAANRAVSVNDAVAALIYVVLGNLLSELILRFAPAPRVRA